MENTTNNIVISVGRQFGCKGRVVGKLIAEHFGFKFYDAELINLAAREIGFSPEFFEKSDEKPRMPEFFQNVGQLFLGTTDNASSDNYLSSGKMFEIQSEAIKHVAEKSNCVIMGRCSDYVLRNNPNLLSIYLSAPMDFRIKCVMERDGLSQEDAQKKIDKTDKKRATYYNYYTDKEWGHSLSYDLCIDVSLIGVEATADYICQFIEKRFENSGLL